MRRTWIFTAALLALALITAACSGAEEASDGARVGKEAPKFSLTSASGDQVSLDDYLGQRPVLLYFSMGPG